MNKKIKIYIKTMVIISIFMLLNSIGFSEEFTKSDIQLIVNGENITELSEPIIINGRMLVPIRFITEEMGAHVYWNGENRTVKVEMDNKSIFLWIGSHLVEYNESDYNLSDVAPIIIKDRTYVPLRLVSNAFGVGIEWNGDTRTVYVDSSETSEVNQFFDIDIISYKDGDAITENTDIEVFIPSKYQNKTVETKLLLLDKNTAKGFVVAYEKGAVANLFYSPKIEDKGEKILVVALYDKNQKFIGGDSIVVNIDVEPKVSLIGVENGSIYKTITMSQELNFLSPYVSYELTNLETDKVIKIEKRDPEGRYSWTPSFEGNGSYSVKVIAYDRNDNPYESEIVNVEFSVDKRLLLGGVSEGMTINKLVTLIASRNFDVLNTEYIIKDVNTGIEENIATIPYGGYKWFPDSKYSGDKQLFVRVEDVRGNIYTSNPINVKIDGSPKVLLHGVGPNQVLTGEAELSVSSNVELDSISYTITNLKTGENKYLSSNLGMDDIYVFIPSKEDRDVKIQVEAMYQGNKIYSDTVTFRVYLGTTYGPRAVIEKDKFLNFASILAKKSLDETGMSASLQVAQAILETGWGQRVPVDKYTGQFSFNLFGIKGTGTNGSVISNTWEVYNGVVYRVDANFRAYNNVNEGWYGHKGILLNLSRYALFRDVMYDSTLGAWAVKRAGYATDPKYPIKLLDIIKRYNLEKLDELGI